MPERYIWKQVQNGIHLMIYNSRLVIDTLRMHIWSVTIVKLLFTALWYLEWLMGGIYCYGNWPHLGTCSTQSGLVASWHYIYKSTTLTTHVIWVICASPCFLEIQNIAIRFVYFQYLKTFKQQILKQIKMLENFWVNWLHLQYLASIWLLPFYFWGIQCYPGPCTDMVLHLFF